MILALRTDKPEAELYLYDLSGKLVNQVKWQAHRKLAETIHYQIATLSQFDSKAAGELSGIVVYEGPGSFTGLRIGISVANALAYSLNVPIVAASGPNWQESGHKLLKSAAHSKFAVPNYGSPARTTTQKK